MQAAPAAGALKAAQPKAAAPASLKSSVTAAKAIAAVARPAAAPRALPAAVDKPDASRLTAPATPRHLAEKAAAARQQQINAAATAAATAAASKKPLTQRNGFKTSEFIVYPAHGVGRIIGIEEQEIAGISLELFVIQFEKDKMTLRVPTGKSQSVGMRKLSDDGVVKRAMETLKGKARIKRTMWSRRAQEYEAKINSGDLIAIAEVVRDLYRSETQPEQSYSERQLYEAALDRMAREIAAVEKLDERGAMQRITDVLSKSAKGRRIAEETAGGGAEIKAA
jgi:CarD family transcriptional regulator